MLETSMITVGLCVRRPKGLQRSGKCQAVTQNTLLYAAIMNLEIICQTQNINMKKERVTQAKFVNQLKNKFEGKIEPLINSKSFYMVFVEGSNYAPILKHDNYEDAFNECLRLANKENKKAFVLLAVSQVELIPNVTHFKSVEK